MMILVQQIVGHVAVLVMMAWMVGSVKIAVELVMRMDAIN